ncbi:TBC1 domain family member 16 isoform X2 [Lampris incognitus]|uniref:TBC1 domain family member 16 isoform X2 n=1 Tax=Lampris incognitus TaxID=2546036 RepID=UPI0024B58820|nr:TBC1 domain family member 16 isoform X2 [Lampris incognitus]
MSLGRLLRRASSRASDLLTFNPGAGGSSSRSGLDGEIIFSKNNVCVHPSEPLPGLAEHHPGYLCVHMEKDESLGTTLILTWVPNSRIQRQDEEALRYITPESSPVRRSARRRGRRPHSRPPVAQEEEEDEERNITSTAAASESQSPGVEAGVESSPPQHPLPPAGEEGDEGSCEFSDDVSRDSTMGSDSDTFSSPFCLSPVSEALCESSSSVFLDNESRELCDESMIHSASSASSLDSHAPSENNSQSQGVRWEEQQKVLALEQLCGVFRVDLGHMRSLRLFFSDEACTSGQLVIASRESQYKILHFHHAGLDKLAEVFQQWKCCRETHLKDQMRSLACSFPSVGPPCPRRRPTQRKSFTGGSMSPPGSAT